MNSSTWSGCGRGSPARRGRAAFSFRRCRPRAAWASLYGGYQTLDFHRRGINLRINDVVPVSGARALHLSRHSKPLPFDHRQSSALPGEVGADPRQCARGERLFSFTDLLTIKQVAADLESGIALRVILRTLLAAHQGQLALDFQPGHGGDAPRAKVVSLSARKEQNSVSAAAAISPGPRPRAARRSRPTPAATRSARWPRVFRRRFTAR